MYDFITMGSATMDVFVESDDARIVSVAATDVKSEFMAFPYGSKLDIKNFAFEVGGGGLNTAINLSNLGFGTSTIIKIGNDPMSKEIMAKIEAKNVDKSHIVVSNTDSSGFSIILISFQGDRTVLAHRGANAALMKNDINFEAIKQAKWLYLAPLNGDSTKVLDDIALFAQENNVNLAINLGTSSIKSCKDCLARVLATAEIIILNSEEAQMLTGIKIRPDNTHVTFSDKIIHPDMIEILKRIEAMGEGIAVVTDGKAGAYAYDGKNFYQCSEFPAKVVSTLGAGDAFASTFTAAFVKNNGNIDEALKFASVNAASVVGHFGAQEGFLTFDEIEKQLAQAADFKVCKI